MVRTNEDVVLRLKLPGLVRLRIRRKYGCVDQYRPFKSIAALIFIVRAVNVPQKGGSVYSHEYDILSCTNWPHDLILRNEHGPFGHRSILDRY